MLAGRLCVSELLPVGDRSFVLGFVIFASPIMTFLLVSAFALVVSLGLRLGCYGFPVVSGLLYGVLVVYLFAATFWLVWSAWWATWVGCCL